MEGAIRFLVEQYYDIQKLRIVAFNGIVAYVGSQTVLENQTKDASHRKVENQEINASHSDSENQNQGASQNKSESQGNSAPVKPSIIAHKIVRGKMEVPKEIADLVWYHNSLSETEKQLSKRLNGWSSHHPLRINFLGKIRGIGPILSSALIAWLSPISRFDNISKLWSYCGLAPGQKRRKGHKLNYNPRLKTLMWKVASSFEKQKAEKSVYRTIYQEKKKYYLNREDLAEAITKKVKGAKLHVRLMAMRYTSKHFLADLWLFWRRMEGLSITEPYAVRILGHSNLEAPKLDKNNGGS